MDFNNVNPTPFAFAQPPAALLGRSFAPQLPPTGGYSAADLERMRFALMQSGGDPAMLGRINEVLAMRRDAPSGAPPQLLRPTPQKQSRIGRAVDSAAQARQNLLDALSQSPQ